jgi:hypothetical protein
MRGLVEGKTSSVRCYYDLFPDSLSFEAIGLSAAITIIAKSFNYGLLLIIPIGILALALVRLLNEMKANEILAYIAIFILNLLDIASTIITTTFTFDPGIFIMRESNGLFLAIFIPRHAVASICVILLAKTVLFCGIYKAIRIAASFRAEALEYFSFRYLYFSFRKDLENANNRLFIGAILYLVGFKHQLDNKYGFQAKYTAYCSVFYRAYWPFILLLPMVVANNLIQVFVSIPILNAIAYYSFIGGLIVSLTISPYLYYRNAYSNS